MAAKHEEMEQTNDSNGKYFEREQDRVMKAELVLVERDLAQSMTDLGASWKEVILQDLSYIEEAAKQGRTDQLVKIRSNYEDLRDNAQTAYESSRVFVNFLEKRIKERDLEDLREKEEGSKTSKLPYKVGQAPL